MPKDSFAEGYGEFNCMPTDSFAEGGQGDKIIGSLQFVGPVELIWWQSRDD